MLLQAFGLKVDVPVVNEIITSVCAIAILLGVMIDDTKKTENHTNVSDKTQQTLAQNTNIEPAPSHKIEDGCDITDTPLSPAEESESNKTNKYIGG